MKSALRSRAVDHGYPQLDLDACPGLLVVAAWPDDEVLGVGGTIAALVDQGVDVRVVAVSDRDACTALTGHPGLDRQLPEHRFDQRVAAGILGVTDLLHLGLPTAELSRHTAWLADRLAEVLDALPAGSWCAAPWSGDDDGPGLAVAEAAAPAADRVGAQRLQYPVWYRHWATVGHPGLPWDRVHTVVAPPAAQDRKHDATQWFIGSFRPDARAAVASVVWPVAAVAETFIA
ncbi:PIG-L deacetylase family protein [Mycolicibacterium thermoresistibile]